MKVLFVHQNFPGQFKSLAPALAAAGHEVSALRLGNSVKEQISSINLHQYSAHRSSTKNIHPWLTDFETKIIRAEACFSEAQKLNANGYAPDVIMAHHGWGESMFLKEIWPKVKLCIYCEFHYSARGQDIGFDPEFPASGPESEYCRIKLKNLNNIMHFEIADAAISPTAWQASTFPASFRDKISVIHDGIDTDVARPNSKANFTLTVHGNQKIKITCSDEIITFVNRNLEPYRGYHSFMRALPKILKNRPEARILIIGGNEVSYGPPPNVQKFKKTSWKEIYVDELRPQISKKDWQRIHFLGSIDYNLYLKVLQVSSCHIYLTYPFVLSWSLLEAMSIGCPIVASDTAPVKEVITDRKTGILTNFFSPEKIAKEVIELLSDTKKANELGVSSRQFIEENYDLKTKCIPKQIKLLEKMHAA
ncbi:glycosyltransferase [Paracoccaceae bacterium]|nr:glycosyltransferase [Paracoccaceae bacterium]